MTRMTEEHAAVELVRTIPAPPHRVYRAWLDPELMRQWLAPCGLEVMNAEVDERVGGHYRVFQGADGINRGGFECELLELVPDERIVWRWGFVGPERTDGPVFDSRLTVTFAAAPGGATTLTLRHERLEDLFVAMPDVAQSVQGGWEMVFDKLAAAVATR